MNQVEKSPLHSSQLRELCQSILEESKRAGADHAEVRIAANKGFSISARNAEVETVEYHQDKIVEITVYLGKRTGSASLSDIRSEAVRAGVKAACHIAQFTDEDPFAGLAAEEELAKHYPDLSLAHAWPITVSQAIQLACDCEEAALSQDKRIMSAEEVNVVTGEMWHAYANTNGFVGVFPYTRHEMSCVLVAKQDKEMQRDYSYTVAANPAHLTPFSQLAEQAVQRTVSRLGARRIATTKAPVIFLAEEARSLLGHFVAAISGGNLYRKSSFLLDHLGKKIFPSFIQIKEHPHLNDALGSAPFDDDGVATRSNLFIKDGVLEQYALSVYSGKKLGMSTTGNAGGIHNLTIQSTPPETKSAENLAALLKTMDRGLLICEMMGQGVNLVTGDYSKGVGGYWVEHGEIQYPVHEITVAGHLQDMYANIVKIGNDVDTRGNIRTGSILIEEMMIAGS